MKKIITTGVVMIMMISIIGCGNQTIESEQKEPTDVTVSNDNPDKTVDSKPEPNPEPTPEPGATIGLPDDKIEDSIPTDEYEIGETITVGEIMSFDGDVLHVLSGDMVLTFNYDQSQAESYYLGQTISLIKGETTNTIEPYLIEDFSIKHTSMGDLMTEFTGTVSEVSDESMTLIVDGEDIHINMNIDAYVEKDMNITAVCGDFGGGMTAIYILHEDSKLVLTVKAINRSDDGQMLLSLVDDNGGEYNVGTEGAILELNLSEVAIGDELIFYHEGVMESWPMQLATVLITK